jgi:hypothetical protein
MFAGYIWDPYNRCDIDFSLKPYDYNITNIISMVKTQFTSFRNNKLSVNCKYNAINSVVYGEGIISDKLFVFNVSIDATGCDTIEVAPFDYVAGPLINFNITGTISITHSPSPQN